MRNTRKSKGIALLLVLGTIVVTTVMGLAFVSSQSTNLGIAQNVNRHAMARAIAEAGMELALSEVQTNSNWRSDYSHGAWVTDESFNGGTFTITGEDGEDTDGDGMISQPSEGDGDISDSSNDPLTLTVVGKYEGVTHTLVNVVKATTTIDTKILMVVSNDVSLETEDQAKKSLFQSWGYTVNVIDDQASQATFDTALAANDVVYVSERAWSPDIGTKLTNATIGVVCEETNLYDELKTSTGASAPNAGTAIEIVDNTHYITSPFSTGTLTIFTSSDNLVSNTGTLASGATLLADQSGAGTEPTVWAVEKGAQLTDSSAATGRRVGLPWAWDNFDMSKLTDDGKTLLRRSIDWAAVELTQQTVEAITSWTTGTTHTAAAGTNRLLIFTADGETTAQVTSVTYGGQTMTEAINAYHYTPSAGGRLQIFYLRETGIAAASGSTFSVTWSGGVTPKYAARMFQNVNQSNPFRDTDSSYVDTATTITTPALTVQDGDYIVAGVHCGNTGSYAWNNSFVEGTDVGSSSFTHSTADWPVTGSPGTVAASTTYSSSVNRQVLGAVVLQGASESSSGVEPNLIALYEFNEAYVAANLIGQWKLDDADTPVVNNVLMMVGNPSSLNSMDTACKNLFEGWGYTVNLIDDDDSQATYDTAFTNNDVLFIAESVYSGGWGKCEDAPIGIVTDDSNYHADLEYSSTDGNTTSDTAIDITNNSHYITSPFSTGSLTIFSSTDEVIYNSGSLASGATTLADLSGGSTTPTLFTIDVGATLQDGSPAEGRRVALPWGEGSFNYSNLNTDGETIFQRAIEWAAPKRAADETISNHGTIKNDATLGATGQFDDAVDFDGIDDYIEIAHHSSYELSKGSVSLWFNADNTTGVKCMFSKDASGTSSGGHLRVYIEGGVIKVRLQSTTTWYFVQSAAINTGTWYHVVTTWGPRGMELYVNGTLVDTDAYTGGLDTSSGGVGNTEPIVIGSDTISSGSGVVTPLQDYFDGTIDDVRIYDQQLDAGQVANVQAGNTPGPPAEGDVVEDTSGYGTAYNLTIPDLANTAWISGGGLDVTSATTIQANDVASKINTALTATDQMSFEIKFTPANLTQNNCARIASYSLSTGARNFTFGQEGQKYEFRLRTSVTGVNGTPGILSGDVLDTTSIHHVIVTFDGTDVKMYRNGTEEASVARGGDFSNWGTTYDFLLANEETDDRTWLGKIYRVAVYDAAFNANQLTNVFNGQPPGDGTGTTTFSARWVEQP